ncbi:hypothetical protein BDB01DRAFT_79799 [Pilobolus umbonatus]|nr:hypothetical protein BDB01DRAFT_79799 [Pilobolus umbonatus]
MGNTLSEIRKNVSNRNHVPSHLKPTKKKRKPKEPKEKEKKDKVSNPISRVPLKNPAPRIVSVADEDDILVGSGPRGAFRWFKGRRYINHADQGDMNNQFMPNDQLELDRIRVLAFIIRWVLRGYCILCTHIH